MTALDRDAAWALATDRYLDALLASAPAGTRPPGAPPAAGLPGLAPGIREAAAALRGAVVRVHPSFAFEERLAARLAAVARPAGGRVVPFPGGRAADPDLAAIAAGTLDPAGREGSVPRLAVGLAVASALSVLGLAWLVRRARPAALAAALPAVPQLPEPAPLRPSGGPA